MVRNTKLFTYCFLGLITFVSFSSIPLSIPESKRWTVTKESGLELIIGTNIKNYHCLSVGYGGKDTMEEFVDPATGQTTFRGEIRLNSTSFDCHNYFMTKDFRKTIKADQFPELIIQFEHLTKSRDSPVGELTGMVIVTLAGKSKKYDVHSHVIENNKNNKHIEGNRSIRLSDFEIEPPHKIFGAIRVKDQVLVDFHLKLRSL